MNNNFYIIDLKHNDLIKVVGDFAVFMFGVQQVNMKIFCTVVRRSMNNIEKARKFGEQVFSSPKITKKTNMMLIEAQQCVQRMEIASLKRYVQIKQA